MGEAAEELLKHIEFGNTYRIKATAKFDCPFCTRLFYSRQGQQDHIKMKHGDMVRDLQRAAIVEYLQECNRRSATIGHSSIVFPHAIDSLASGLLDTILETQAKIYGKKA